MRINVNNPDVIGLLKIWRDEIPPHSKDLSQKLQRLMIRDIVQPAIGKHTGELILFYHRFLSNVPSGNHSFAHGSEMVTKTVYWVRVGRMTGDSIVEVPEVIHPPLGPKNGPKIVPVTFGKYLVPVFWDTYLNTQYRRKINPNFVLDKKCVLHNESKFDVSEFGRHLFRLHEGRYDRSRNIEIFVGDESVGGWLREHKSAGTYNQLRRM